jgi:hypothetical protein
MVEIEANRVNPQLFKPRVYPRKLTRELNQSEWR